MARLVKMLGGVPVWRIVATADMAAGPAQPQMDPWRTCLQALLATERTGRHLANRVGVGAFGGHQCLRVLAGMVAPSPRSARKVCSAATTCARSPTAAAT